MGWGRAEEKAARAARRVEVRAAKAREAAETAERRRRQEMAAAADRRAIDEAAARVVAVYREVRPHVLRMRETLSTDEQPTRARLEPSWDGTLWEATPDQLRQWRRACALLTGIGPEAYEAPEPALVARLKRDVRLLQRQVGPSLGIPESPALGGFGVRLGGELWNEDAARCFSALAALQDGAVLGAFSDRPGDRCLVWEIGGGWGGFAWRFKQLFPHVTYVVTAPPQALLVSAVYLSTLLPSARCRFHGTPGDLWAGWEDVDFVFVPESAVPALRPPRLDAVFDVLTLRTMDAPRIARHVRQAYEAGARYVYSMLPAEATAAEAARVWDAIAERYWPHPVPPRAETLPPVVAGTSPEIPEATGRHLVGWRRLDA